MQYTKTIYTEEALNRQLSVFSFKAFEHEDAEISFEGYVKDLNLITGDAQSQLIKLKKIVPVVALRKNKIIFDYLQLKRIFLSIPLYVFTEKDVFKDVCRRYQFKILCILNRFLCCLKNLVLLRFQIFNLQQKCLASFYCVYMRKEKNCYVIDNKKTKLNFVYGNANFVFKMQILLFFEL